MFKAVATFTSAYVEDRILLVGGRDISSNLLEELLECNATSSPVHIPDLDVEKKSLISKKSTTRYDLTLKNGGVDLSGTFSKEIWELNLSSRRWTKCS